MAFLMCESVFLPRTSAVFALVPYAKTIISEGTNFFTGSDWLDPVPAVGPGGGIRAVRPERKNGFPIFGSYTVTAPRGGGLWISPALAHHQAARWLFSPSPSQ